MIVTSTVSPSLKIGLRLLGVWPGVSYSIISWLIYMSSIVILQYFQYLYVFAHFSLNELSNLVDSLPTTLNYTLTFLKLSSLWINRRIIHQIVDTMNNDWQECVGIEHHLYLMTIKASISHFCSNAMLSFYIIAGILYLLGEYAIHAVHLAGDYNDTSRQLPVKIQLPFETEQSPIFEVLALMLSLHVISNVCTVSVINALIFTLVLHLGGQIDIMCQDFKNINEKISFRKSSASTIEMLVERHNKIIFLSDNMEKLFSFIALMQVFWNTLVMCCLGIIVIISVNNGAGIIMIVKTIFAYFGIMIEIFNICFAGEYLSLKSKSIADAAYDSLWYNLPLNKSKLISFIIMRSQKRLAITAGKMTNLSLEAFTSIMKASVSYVSVLYAMY
nr:PREDICTED: odorant receptor 22c-like [Linepithema humile]